MTSIAYLCLSFLGLPRDPGYWKCRSSPSKPMILRNLILVLANFTIRILLFSMTRICFVPRCQPPTESSVFSPVYLCLMAFTCSYLKHRNHLVQLSQLLWVAKYNICFFACTNHFMIYENAANQDQHFGILFRFGLYVVQLSFSS